MFSYIPNLQAFAANDDRAPRERTVPIPESITAVAGYPSKLVVFKIAASKFWQVRCWMDGRTYRRSTKCTSLKLAQRFARWFYEELVASKFTTHASAPNDIQGKTNQKSQLTFGAIAAQVYANEQSRVERGEFGAGSLRMFRNRLDAHVLPRFGQLAATQIDCTQLLTFCQFLSKSMSTTSVSNYLMTVRKVLQQAVRVGLLDTSMHESMKA